MGIQIFLSHSKVEENKISLTMVGLNLTLGRVKLRNRIPGMNSL